MTILSFTEDWKAQKTAESLQSGQTATRVFNVYSDTHDEVVSNVYNAIPVRLGDVFPGTFACVCTERNADRNTDDRTTWTVTCNYSSVLNQTQQDRVNTPNPLDRSTRISWSSRTVMRAVTRCDASGFYQAFSDTVTFDGKPDAVANSATDPFDPPLEVPMTEWIMTCTKNVANVPAWFKEYDNSVNNADQIIEGETYKKGTLKLEGIRFSEKMKENGFDYRQLSWNVIVAKPRAIRTGGTYLDDVGASQTVPDETIVPEPWDVEVLDEGMRTYSVDDKKWSNIETVSGEVNKPVPLDGVGEALNPTEEQIPAYALWWRLFRPYPRKNFAILPW